MTTASNDAPPQRVQGHRRFAAFYERCAQGRAARRILDPLRAEVIGEARGVVLEIGAGTGLNFALYDPARVERVEAVEPDTYMLRYARHRLATARVPLALTQAPAEVLPFANATFDTALATLVFCSVAQPEVALREVMRVLKPGGTLLLVEHVRGTGSMAGWMQDAMVPLTTRMLGGCHWNRDTAEMVAAAGFDIERLRRIPMGLQPHIVLKASKPA